MRQLVYSALLLLVSGSCQAASANFTVEGQVTASTCKVTNKDQEVNLPTAPKSNLKAVGDIWGKTPFSIEVSGCSGDTFVYFEGNPLADLVVNTSGRLVNTTPGGAQNVQLQILNKDGGAVDINAPKGDQGSSAVGAVTANNAKFDFFVQYYATGAATTGKVASSITFLLESL